MLKARLEEDLRDAMRKREELRLSVLRLAKSAIHNREIDLKRPLSEDEIMEVLNKEMKKRREAIEEFKKGNRSDLVSKEEAELRILEGYFPPPLPEEEIRSLAKQAISEVGAKSPSDLGKVMGKLLPSVKHRAPGEKVASIVREELAR